MEERNYTTAASFERFLMDGGNEDLSNFLYDALESGNDAEYFDSEMEDILWETLSNSYIVRAGVEKLAVTRHEWDWVYKFYITSVGDSEDDFQDICNLADENGFGDLFLSEEVVPSSLPCKITKQWKARGNYIGEDETNTNKTKLSAEAASVIVNQEYEKFYIWLFTLYGEDYGFAFRKFAEEYGVWDLHSGNFVVNGDQIEIYDACFYCW